MAWYETCARRRIEHFSTRMRSSILGRLRTVLEFVSRLRITCARTRNGLGHWLDIPDQAGRSVSVPSRHLRSANLQCLTAVGSFSCQDPTISADCLLKIRSILRSINLLTYLLCVGVWAVYTRGWAAATQRFWNCAYSCGWALCMGIWAARCL